MGPEGRLMQKHERNRLFKYLSFLIRTISNPLWLHAQGGKVPYFSNVRHYYVVEESDSKVYQHVNRILLGAT